MTWLNVVIVALASVGLTTCARSEIPADNAGGNGVAVVELFTSEGCSSCPAADAVLARVRADAVKAGHRVYTIAWHVDYWDHLGWPDRFAAAAYTARQHAYIVHFHGESNYTPEMVVNGSTEFVGSRSEQADRAIAAALKSPVAAAISVKATAVDEAVAVEYAVTTPPAGAMLNVVLVERDLSTTVRRGENGGRVLKHDHVARAWQTVDALADHPTGKLTLKLPDGVKIENTSVIAFVQDAKSMNITVAADAAVIRK